MIMKMITNIFNIFDPSSNYFFSLNWLSTLIIFTLLPYQFWFIPSYFILSYFISTNFLFKEFKIILKFSYSNLILFTRLFFLITFNNFIGLFPYIFTSSSHIRFCFSLSLTIWTRIILFGWINFTNHIFIHLTPSNTPYILIPFIVIIEFIRLIIRPITLSIRLTANIIAGHLLLSLLGSSNINVINLYTLITIIFIQIILFILEISVSLIQSYVFSILSLLYRKEILYE